MSEIHPHVAHLSFLIGSWSGTGRGEYPTIESFSYREETTFVARDEPLIEYEQRTWHAVSGEALHAERGYWRPVGLDRVEVVIAMSTGFVVIHDGVIDGLTITLRSASIQRAPSAKHVEIDERHISVEGDEMTYEHAMAAVGRPLSHHLSAVLRKASNQRR